MAHVLGCTTRPYAALPLAEACRRIATAGYADVAVFHAAGESASWSEATPADIERARRAAAGAGLRPSMLLGRTRLERGLDAAVADYRRLLDHAAALGVKWLLDCGTSDPPRYADYYELMRRTAPHAEQAGVRITLKPHGGITLTVEDLARAHREVGHRAFGICYDPGNLIYYTKGARRPETGIAAIAPAVSTVIIKDCVLRDGEPDVMVTPGEGLVDFRRVLGGLVDAGFQGPLYVECVGGKSPDEIDANLRATRTFVAEILRGAAGAA